MDGYVLSKTRIAPAPYDVNPPEPMLNSVVTLGNYPNSVAQVCDKISINPGTKVELYTSPATESGYIGAHVTGERDASIELDPDMQSLEDEDWWNNTIAGQPLNFVMNVGTSIIITANNAQVVQSGKPGEREGHITHSVKLRACRGENGDDELQIQINDKA
jgi:hypothetical protein